MNEMTVGYVGLSKASWATPKIVNVMETALGALKKLPVRVVHADSLTTTEAEAIELCERFKREGVDAIVMHFASFPLGAMIPAIAGRLKVPVILFANPEVPEAGGIWSRNSFCGANMAAHVLNKLGNKYEFVWGKSELAAEAMESVIKPLAAMRNLADFRLGLIGGRVPGFYTSNFDEMRLRSVFGTTVEVIELLEVINEAGKIPDGELDDGMKHIRNCSNGSCAVSDTELQLAGKLVLAFEKTVAKYNLAGLAVRCWPEISDIYGIAPCAAMGILNDMGIPISCEGDVPGVLTMRLQQALSGGLTPFFADLISFDYDDNTGVLWHCGAAPVSLCRNFAETTLRKHARVDGGDKKGVTNDFSLKPGRITLSKLDETSEGYRMLIAGGTALDTEPFIRGNPLRIKFDCNMKNLISTIMTKGFEHHYSVIHADVVEELLAFCKLKDIEPVVAD